MPLSLMAHVIEINSRDSRCGFAEITMLRGFTARYQAAGLSKILGRMEQTDLWEAISLMTSDERIG
jgi:hypothetical protein